jgi:predicted nuclease of predicted toxin-antitoxin system
MKVLLDSCIGRRVREALEAAGHDVAVAAIGEIDPGDEAILRRAHREGRTLITLDKDFGELAIVHGLPHAGILRLVNLTVSQRISASQQVLQLHGEELAAGSILTAEPGRLRIRPPG